MEKNQSKILFTYKNTTIRQADFQLLSEGEWLNDSCVSFYLEYLNDYFQM